MRGEAIPVDYQFALREFLRILPMAWLNKQSINLHTVDTGKWIGCRMCVKKCPAGAIDPARGKIDRNKCLACFGCLNNCFAQAVTIEYNGKRLYGFREYLARKKIRILEPEEFKTCRL
jgi:uncharacterized Fe-S center protein